MVTLPILNFILANQRQPEEPLLPAFNQYVSSLGYKIYVESYSVGKSSGFHEIYFSKTKGVHCKIKCTTFDISKKPRGVLYDGFFQDQAVYAPIPMRLPPAGVVESTADPKNKRAQSVCIRFNIEDAYVYISYGQQPGGGYNDSAVGVAEAYKLIEPIAIKYSALLKAEVQKLRREKKTRKGNT